MLPGFDLAALTAPRPRSRQNLRIVDLGF